VEVPLSPGELLEFIDGGDCAPMKRLPKTSNDCGCGDLRTETERSGESENTRGGYLAISTEEHAGLIFRI
jgi:hypothetical protein